MHLSVLIIVKVINNINKVIKLNKNKDSRDLPSSKSTSGSLSAHHHHHTFAASTTGIHWGILRRIHLGVMDRGLFYRPIHSVKAALPKRRRRRPPPPKKTEIVYNVTPKYITYAIYLTLHNGIISIYKNSLQASLNHNVSACSRFK
jgi:hypothetical protein